MPSPAQTLGPEQGRRGNDGGHGHNTGSATFCGGRGAHHRGGVGGLRPLGRRGGRRGSFLHGGGRRRRYFRTDDDAATLWDEVARIVVADSDAVLLRHHDRAGGVVLDDDGGDAKGTDLATGFVKEAVKDGIAGTFEDGIGSFGRSRLGGAGGIAGGGFEGGYGFGSGNDFNGGNDGFDRRRGGFRTRARALTGRLNRRARGRRGRLIRKFRSRGRRGRLIRHARGRRGRFESLFTPRGLRCRSLRPRVGHGSSTGCGRRRGSSLFSVGGTIGTAGIFVIVAQPIHAACVPTELPLDPAVGTIAVVLDRVLCVLAGLPLLLHLRRWDVVALSAVILRRGAVGKAEQQRRQDGTRSRDLHDYYLLSI